VEYTTIS
jgi:hypothetical protein